MAQSTASRTTAVVSVLVPVMRVGTVWMRMDLRIVRMQVSVRTGRHHVMVVPVM